MANCNRLPNIVNQQQSAVVAVVASAGGANSVTLASLATSVTQTVSGAPLSAIWWSGTWAVSRPATNGLSNTILSLSGSGEMLFDRDGAFTLSTNSTGTITATTTGAGMLVMKFRKDFTDTSLA